MVKTKFFAFQCLNALELEFSPATVEQLSAVRAGIREGIRARDDRSDIIVNELYTTLGYHQRCPHCSLELGIAPCDECENAQCRLVGAPQWLQTWEFVEDIYWSEMAKMLRPVEGVQ